MPMIMFDALRKFNLLDTVDSVEQRGRGSVNRSYIVHVNKHQYLLQLANFQIFKNINKVIENIDSIDKYLKKASPDYRLDYVKTTEGEKHVVVKESYWRCYHLKNYEKIYKKVCNDEMTYEIGKLVGCFHKLTSAFSIKNLNVTIPNFHNTFKYYENLETSTDKCKSDRSLYTWNENKFTRDRIEEIKLLQELLKEKKIPLVVTHNNIRISNIIFDERNNHASWLAGYEAIMPGSRLHDFGDAARYLLSTTREDEGNLDIVSFNIDRFKLFSKGYLEETYAILNDVERDHLVDAIKSMALEYGIRHLTDYLDGDKKFKVDHKTQNWDICKNQFKLVEDIELHYDELKAIINNTYQQIKNVKQAL